MNVPSLLACVVSFVRCAPGCHFGLNPFGTVDGYSSSLRDATGPVDEYSRIPTSTQVTLRFRLNGFKVPELSLRGGL